MTIDLILQKFEKVKQRNDHQWQALCPVHDDKKLSLSIEETEEKILLNCHAGCENRDIIESIGLKLCDLFKKNWNKEEKSQSNEKIYSEDWIVKNSSAYYFYDNCHGNRHILKTRYIDKNSGEEIKGCFWSYTGEGWKRGLNGSRPVLYKLPDLLKGIKDNRKIFIVEGEKDADTLIKMGFVATTSGASESWKTEFTEYFKNYKGEIINIPDQDKAGYKYRDSVISSFQEIVKIKIINLPGLIYQEKHGEDITDWINKGHTAEELKELVVKTPLMSTEKTTNSITDNIRLFSYDDILNSSGDMEDNAIISNLFYREGISMIFGEPGCGKTWLMMDAIINLAEGRKVWGRYNCEPKKVLLLEGDFSFLLLKHRLKNFALSEIGRKNFRSLTAEEFEKKNFEYCLDNEDGKNNIEAFIKSYKPDILAIDSLCSFMAGDESRSDSVKPILSYLRTLSQKYKIHIMIIHHSRKRTSMERQGRKLDQSDMIGSSLFQRKVDSLFAVNTIYEDDEKIDNKGMVTDVKGWMKYKTKFEYSIVDNEYGIAEIKYNYENFESAKPKKQKAKEAIFNILFYNPDDPKSKKQLISLTQINFRTIENALKQLIEEDKIETIGTTTDRKYKIKIKNKYSPENLNSDFNSNILSPNTIKTHINNNIDYIYQGNDSNIEDVRVMLELKEKDSDSNMTLTSDMLECSPVLPRKSYYSNIDLSCMGELKEKILECESDDDENFNRDEVPF